MKEKSNSQLTHPGFSVFIPKEWHDISNIVLMGELEDDMAPMITLCTLYGKDRLEVEASAMEAYELLRSRLPADHLVLISSGALVVAEQPAHQFTVRFLTHEGSVWMWQRQVHVGSTNPFLVVSAIDKEQRSESIELAFNSVLATLSIFT